MFASSFVYTGEQWSCAAYIGGLSCVTNVLCMASRG